MARSATNESLGTSLAAPGVERASLSFTEGSAEDDGFDFPPAAHPGRELFTFSLFVLLILTALVWGVSRLISLGL